MDQTAKPGDAAKKWLVPIFVVGTVAAVVIGLGANGEPAAPEESPAPSFGQGDAILNCQDAVKRHLNNPSTADFSIFDTEATRDGNGGWDVAGTVTAANDFGAEQEVAFDCHVKEGEPVEVEVSQN